MGTQLAVGGVADEVLLVVGLAFGRELAVAEVTVLHAGITTNSKGGWTTLNKGAIRP